MSLVAERLGVRLGGHDVLTGVELALEQGTITALVGPNGAGKSTLLAAFAGDLSVASGRVLLDGHPITRFAPRDLGRRRAVLVQQPQTAFAYRAGAVVAMGRWPWEGTALAADDESAIAGAVERADVATLVDRYATALSGGEAARVAFARVVAQRTRVVLLDEPTAALDIGHQTRVLATARDLAAAGALVVIVLHDLNLAAGYADRIAVLDRGRVVADGVPAEVLTGPTLSAVYRHPISVVAHPLSGVPLVLPRRG
ncbi:heme ABC transporter ATP-binding protein [Gryllotalpicola reticulitermitis]|uniref:Heme ABC transporter ATP-binding protein n=1 Tax=Gryllotalpicola reticulitermitis TaxID=1184153 RepID=A0ABV8Q9K7_9MICO